MVTVFVAEPLAPPGADRGRHGDRRWRIGVLGAYRVQMTQMPQLVALFNGVGGGAAAIVALIELAESTGRSGPAAAVVGGA